MTVRVACVGAGYFSQFHYHSWERIERVELVGSCDHDLALAEATGVHAFDRLEDMLDTVKPDLLDIVLPPQAHAETIRSALAMGVKWMVCQKPFCLSLAEAREIVAEAEAQDATIVVHENFRFQPWYRRIKAAIEDGLIGEVYQVTYRLRPGDGQGPQAYMDRQPYFQKMPRLMVHETGVHFVDTFRYLLGNPLSVYADLRRINPVIAGEDAGMVLFEHSGNARALLDGNRLVDHASDNLRRTMGEASVEGSTGCLSLFGDGSVHHRAFHSTQVKVLLPSDTWEGFGGDCVHHLQNHVISGLIDGTPIENRAEDYLIVNEIEEAIYRSAETGRKLQL